MTLPRLMKDNDIVFCYRAKLEINKEIPISVIPCFKYYMYAKIN